MSRTPEAPPRDRQFVQSLERGLAVIRALSAQDPQTLSDVARTTGLTRAASRRFLLTLEQLGYVTLNGTRFALTPQVLELGYAYLSSLTLPEVAQPHLERLVEEIHESSSVSVLDGADVVYVARVPTRRIMRVAISVGTRFPAYATSMGRVLLAGLEPARLDAVLAASDLRALTPETIQSESALRAELDRVRAQGWALVDQELEAGLRSVAAPIRGSDGAVVAAVNVSANATRTGLDDVRAALLPALLSTAEAIERDLAAARPPATAASRPAGGAPSTVTQREAAASRPAGEAPSAVTQREA
ncbi:MAG TPA: IclR family transcriptional regulator C-terminal domain-containing protein [Baekduia sp.]|nr:IclR family transcriptional regulator C-terminal domain-containing protein [Baekduia sp.]